MRGLKTDLPPPDQFPAETEDGLNYRAYRDKLQLDSQAIRDAGDDHVTFTGTEDYSLQTSFVIDDASLPATG